MQSFFEKSQKKLMQADVAAGLYKQKAGMIQWYKPFSEKCREHRRDPGLPRAAVIERERNRADEYSDTI
jgi:hypothetical protein